MSLVKLRASMIGTLAALIGLSTLFFTVILSLLGTLNLVVLAGFVVIFNLIQWLLAPYIIDAMYGVKEMPEAGKSRIFYMVERLCRRIGIPTPKLMLSNIPIPNAFAYGSPLTGSRIALTRGLLETLEEEEVEAVIGHELGHIKHRDMQVMMFASVIPAIFYYIGYSLMFSGWQGGYGGRRDRDQGGAALLGIGALAVYWILSLFVLGLSRLREYYADRLSAESVDDGARKLSEALAKISTYTGKVKRRYGSIGSLGSFKALFIDDPDRAEINAEILSRGALGDEVLVREILRRKVTLADRIMEVFSTHPNIVKRLKALQELRR
ncbi:MAG: zinc metalloprotease HtpX [Candidatus Bathyarchaeia archaeon]